MEMQEVFSARSVNWRYGVSIVALGPVEFPAKGKLTHLGTAAGIESYLFERDSEGDWVLACNDELRVVSGATSVVCLDLQNNRYVTILVATDSAVVCRVGYKQRSRDYMAVVDGQMRSIPPSVLLAMGLIESDVTPKTIEKPEPLTGAMAAAFGKLQSLK